MNIISELVPISPPSAKTWEIDQAAEAVAQGGGVDGDSMAWDPGQPDRSRQVESHRQDGVRAAARERTAGWLGHRHLIVVEEQRSGLADDELPDHGAHPAPVRAAGYAITATSLFTDPDMAKVYPYAKPFGDALANRLSPGRGRPTANDVIDIMAKHVNAVVVGDEKPEDGAKAMNQEVDDLRTDRGLITS